MNTGMLHDWHDDGHQARLTFEDATPRLVIDCPLGNYIVPEPAGATGVPACRRTEEGEAEPQCQVYAASLEFTDEELWDLGGEPFEVAFLPMPVAWRRESTENWEGIWVRPALPPLERLATDTGNLPAVQGLAPCPTACDQDCEAYCHEMHHPAWKRVHGASDHHPSVAGLARAYLLLLEQYAASERARRGAAASRARMLEEAVYADRQRADAIARAEVAEGELRRIRARSEAAPGQVG